MTRLLKMASFRRPCGLTDVCEEHLKHFNLSNARGSWFALKDKIDETFGLHNPKEYVCVGPSPCLLLAIMYI